MALNRSLQRCMAIAQHSQLKSLHHPSRGPAGPTHQLNKQKLLPRQISCSAAAMDISSNVSHAALVRSLRAVVPDLTTDSYKGQQGKVGVMGGCREYTGAPFFAAMSSLRMGCDLAYVFCTPSAAPVIKGYSPELIVIPTLLDTHELEKMTDDQAAAAKARFSHDLKSWLGRLSVLVIGPGLGDDPTVGECMYEAVEAARELQLPLLIDGSGLNFVAQKPEVVAGYQACLLTPNIAEFGRLAGAVGLQLQGNIGVQWQQQTQQLAAALSGPTVVSKGPHDVISDGQQVLLVQQEGSPRRCGGQGDVLTGTTAAFISWVRSAERKQQKQQDSDAAAQPVPPLMLAAYGGCLTMRAAAQLTYRDKTRSTLAVDMIGHLGDPVLRYTSML